MNSGTPEPADDLSLILNLKKSNVDQALDVVSKASRWLKSQLNGIHVDYHYTPCEEGDPSAFAMFSVTKDHQGAVVVLDMKVAEINGKPFIFAQVLQVGSRHGQLFPFFADISTDESKQNLLHYIADFLLA
ncbi:MAG: hypothetical protein ACPGKS_05270 [Coraliomargarita sp.]